MSIDKIKSLKDYIPKEDTQQIEFLKRYPNYDGRGVLIAVIDDGIDISVPGMQYTSTNLPKVVDFFDCTGYKNVHTSTVQETEANDFITGKSGRKLKDDKEKRQAYSKSYDEKRKQGKSVIDCVVWFDGQRWLACVDTSMGDNIQNVKVLTNYRDEYEFAYATNENVFWISIKNDGNLLEIGSTYGIHGTAVAYIAAAHFPNEPQRSGLAPGAQIFTIIVGAKCLKKALLKCIDMKVDIVNLSQKLLYLDE
uniref:Peptidase S8/S53 domain-containing protein n=1 Tax=Panagrolaimus superbus TaxID=310955 RepID=A0A914Z7P9_9BILA